MTPQEVLKKFLVEEKNFNVDEDQGNGFTALMRAARSGAAKGVELLLDLGADPNKYNNGKRDTPLTWAAFEGHYAVVKLLLEMGANTELPNLGGTTPLGLAKREGYEDIVELLKKYGATK